MNAQQPGSRSGLLVYVAIVLTLILAIQVVLLLASLGLIPPHILARQGPEGRLNVVIEQLGHARKAAQTDTCINYLRMIDAAKQQWALGTRKRSSDVPTWQDLTPYLGTPGDRIPECPTGGRYEIHSVVEPPTCTVPRHEIQ